MRNFRIEGSGPVGTPHPGPPPQGGRGNGGSLWVVALGLALAVMGAGTAAAHDPPAEELRLPVIGPAPEFSLTSQDGETVTLEDFRGRALAVTFIYTACPDYCPMLTAKMVGVQDDLGDDFGARVAFVSITVDPELDTPEVLRHYALVHGADLQGWAFLTGEPEAIAEVTRNYGVFAQKAVGGEIDHTFLTSLIDPEGILRVQYMGVRFDPDEFRSDLVSLLDEP
jgi:protein SCO1